MPSQGAVRGPGSTVIAIAGQTPVSITPQAVAPPTPPPHAQSPAQDRAAYTIIPATALGQGGQQTAVQYIVEPVSTPGMHSPKAGVAATITPTHMTTGNPRSTMVFHVPSQTHITDNKPTSNVSALHLTTSKDHSGTCEPRSSPVLNPSQYSVVPATTYLRPNVTQPGNPSAPKQAVPSQNSLAPGSVLQPNGSYMLTTGNSGSFSVENKCNTNSPTESIIKEIGKKIGDAFVNCSEAMLVAAFEDAWKKFQANGKKYEALSTVGRQPEVVSSYKPSAPPNAEVVNVPGCSPRLTLVRPAYPQHRVVAKPNSEISRVSSSQPTTPVTSVQPQQQKLCYVYSYAPNATQPQVHLQPTSSDFQVYTVQSTLNNAFTQTQATSKVHQIQSPGALHVSNKDLSSQVILSPVQVITSPKSLAKNNQITLVENPAIAQGIEQKSSSQHQRKSQLMESSGRMHTQKEAKSIRYCSQCSKEATYLCSGCRGVWYCGERCQVLFRIILVALYCTNISNYQFSMLKYALD